MTSNGRRDNFRYGTLSSQSDELRTSEYHSLPPFTETGLPRYVAPHIDQYFSDCNVNHIQRYLRKRFQKVGRDILVDKEVIQPVMENVMRNNHGNVAIMNIDVVNIIYNHITAELENEERNRQYEWTKQSVFHPDYGLRQHAPLNGFITRKRPTRGFMINY